MGKIYAKTEVSKPSQKPLDYAKQSAADALKTSSKRAIQKTAEKIGNEITDKMIRASKSSPTNPSETNKE